jgi:hypothetical protein
MLRPIWPLPYFHRWTFFSFKFPITLFSHFFLFPSFQIEVVYFCTSLHRLVSSSNLILMFFLQLNGSMFLLFFLFFSALISFLMANFILTGVKERPKMTPRFLDYLLFLKTLFYKLGYISF